MGRFLHKKALVFLMGILGLSLVSCVVLYNVIGSRFDPLRALIGSYRNYLEINGSITNDGKYTPPLKNFTCSFPSFLEGTGKVLQDSTAPQVGTVTFSDDFGTVLRIDYETIPPDLPIPENPDMRKKYFEDLLNFVMQELFLPFAPDSSISHREFLGAESEEVLYAVIDFPHGSNLANEKGERLDAVRGIFIFNEGKFIYMLTSQYTVGILDARISDRVQYLKDELQNFYDTCDFEL
jgi:hypothetical protein